jgi:hypothetical protein
MSTLTIGRVVLRPCEPHRLERVILERELQATTTADACKAEAARLRELDRNMLQCAQCRGSK